MSINVNKEDGGFLIGKRSRQSRGFFLKLKSRLTFVNKTHVFVRFPYYEIDNFVFFSRKRRILTCPFLSLKQKKSKVNVES